MAVPSQPHPTNAAGRPADRRHAAMSARPRLVDEGSAPGPCADTAGGKDVGTGRYLPFRLGAQAMVHPKFPPPPRTTARLLTVAETAEFLRLSDKTVRRMISSGDLVSHRIGSSLRLYEHEVRAFVSERRQ